MNCKSCGAPVVDVNSQFCMTCGTQIERQPQNQPPPFGTPFNQNQPPNNHFNPYGPPHMGGNQFGTPGMPAHHTTRISPALILAIVAFGLIGISWFVPLLIDLFFAGPAMALGLVGLILAIVQRVRAKGDAAKISSANIGIGVSIAAMVVAAVSFALFYVWYTTTFSVFW